MSYNPIQIGVLSSTTGIDGKVVAASTLFTVPTGEKAVVTGAILSLTAATAITAVPTIGIGQNATQDDIYYPLALTGVTDTTKLFFLSTIGTTFYCVAGTVIKIGIDIGAVGTLATLRVDLLGYLST